MRRSKILYIEISESIRKKILDGFYPVGTLIPSENELVEEYGVSKITIRNAVELLENEGYVEKKSGVGTRVISDRLFNNLSKAKSFSAIIEGQGQKLTKEIISIEEVSTNEITIDVGALFGKTAFKLTRVYYLSGEPYIYFQHYLPSLGKKEELKALEEDSLYKWLASYNKYPAFFEDQFKVVSLSAQDDLANKILDSPEETILQRIRKTFDDENNIIEVSYGLYNTDKSPYLIEYEV